MITNNELKAVTLSATKKDYYQIWNELLDLAGKISERWDPTSTNESDPGIVLLKVLTALGDKLNYNIDANILEAFMPSAAQMESMRKLCEMMGYNIKYYQSATTEVSMAFVGDTDKTDWQVEVPMFTSFTNSDKDVNYVSIESKIISNIKLAQTIKCIEGQVARCETDNNNIVTINQLDDNNRYYLPENQIAENGIFIYRINDGLKSARWEKVDNLNTQTYNSLVYKFGFDSKENRPYLQFPEDIGQIIEDGLEIYYIRTSGINGNISARTLSTFEKPDTDAWKDMAVEDFSVSNYSASGNGSNIETINQAYNNYKKTIGTFDTLVTCRDYMNAIYNMMSDVNTPVVSNAIVSDIRNDINKSIVLCSFDDYGISYSEKAISDSRTDSISTFDLVLYPFKKVYGLNTKDEYKNSFKLDNTPLTKLTIESGLAKTKNIAHVIKYPNKKDIVGIKNYLLLDAKITTTKKVNIIEETNILNNIKTAIFSQFNARNLDFGEEIPFDSILECIENADEFIKNVSLMEPTLYTSFEFADGTMYDTASYLVEELDTNANDIKLTYPGRTAYNKLALRNIMAGRLELFNYQRMFKYSLDEKPYTYLDGTDEKSKYNSIYPATPDKKLIAVNPKCDLNTSSKISLTKNEIIKFRAPNFVTTRTYPAYINYFIKLKQVSDTGTLEIPATFKTLKEFMNSSVQWQSLADMMIPGYFKSINILTVEDFNNKKDTYGALFISVNDQMTYAATYAKDTKYYYLPINSETFKIWNKWVQTQTYIIKNTETKNYVGIFKALDFDLRQPIGYLVDEAHTKYQQCFKWSTVSEQSALKYFYVQDTHENDVSTRTEDDKIIYGHTADGFGKDAEYIGIPKNADYQLKPGEFLAINYTPAATEGQPEPQPINLVYSATSELGNIIRPNFELIDSATLVNSGKKRYSKTTGYTFKDLDSQLTENLPGMFSLAANEQIEIRNLVKVELNKPATYLYWTLQDEDAAIKEVERTHRYILKDGEYLYYTDYNKTAMAYYGSGSEIIFEGDANFISTKNRRTVSAEKILEKGLEVVPWIFYNFSDNRKCIIQEYRYITLADQDALNSITIADAEPDIITNEWKTVSKANYTTAGVTSALPVLAVDNYKWEVKSSLLLDLSPNEAQILTKNDSLTLVYDDGSQDIIKPRAESNADGADIVDIAVKANYSKYSTADSVNVKVEKYTEADEKVEINDFTIKLYEKKPVGATTNGDVVDPSIVQFHNYNDLWTSVMFSSLKTSTTDHIQFYCNIPDNYFGLLMIYYSGIEDTDTGAHISLNSIDNDLEVIIPKIYNYSAQKDGNESWWSDLTKDGKYFLKKGINVIKIEKPCILKIYPDKENVEMVIFSDIDIISNAIPINKKLLGYQFPQVEQYTKLDTAGQTPDRYAQYVRVAKNTNDTNKNKVKQYKLIAGTDIDKFDQDYVWYKQINAVLESESTKELLDTINKLDPDHKFYYNCPLDTGSALDLNPKLIGTDHEELLSDPHVWYDKNNINNNFVISEIDADYLDRGIQIVRASKR